MMHEADICEIISIPTDSRHQPEISRLIVQSVDELIDEARLRSRITYCREIRAVVNALTVASFCGRYWLDTLGLPFTLSANPGGLAPPSRDDA